MGQDPDSQKGKIAPIYRVTVIERTLKAINYQYRSGPTIIDFRGTVLMPKAKGEATVESRQGRTEINAKLESLTTPQRFGREYLTYVLWAISPEGRPHNIGEIVPNGSDKADLRVTTDLQAFGLLVTAEPYSAVRQPSDVVVAENQVRSDTAGKVEEIDAKYELMPRGQYTWNVSESLSNEVVNAPKVSMRKYEALLELYQAQNAIGVARVARADQYAPDTLAKAQGLLDQAQQLQDRKGETSRVVETAREAAQTAEDARVIAERRKQEEKLTQASAQASAERQARVRAEADAERARADAGAARAQAEAERAARQQAEAEAAAARNRAATAEADAQANQASANAAIAAASAKERQEHVAAEKIELRRQMLEQLNNAATTRDTPRGLVVTVPDRGFNGALLRGTSWDQVARVGALVASHPGLQINVEGHTDSEAAGTLTLRRAEVVRGVLVERGLATGSVSAREFGNARPLASNATARGREENRRVEIVISGDPIGSLPVWDRTYTLSQRENSR
jgi:flagellar motor protein MotB